MKKLSIQEGAKVLTHICAGIKPDERVLIITDEPRKEIGEYLAQSSMEITDRVEHLTIPGSTNHRFEPPIDVAHAMLGADVIFAVTKNSMAHTESRKKATLKGARFLSLPDYDLMQLSRPSLSVDFFKQAEVAETIKKILDKGETVKITTEAGTDLSMSIRGREANCCPGFCHEPGTLGSPPDIETNIAPLEELSEGTLIVDGSIPYSRIGLVTDPIGITIKDGMIKEIDNKNSQGKTLTDIFDFMNPKARTLAEFGVGLNPRAELCGVMLEDEGCLGTIHLGFGSNSTIGGKNQVNFHIDFVIKNPTVIVDENVLSIYNEITTISV